MGLSREEVIELASRYVEREEILDFPHNGELFCLLLRILAPGKSMADEEGWAFAGYGICLRYTVDEEAKPSGKWLWMHFASLESFPPISQVMKLQPPHVVRGRFQNPERTREFRIIKIGVQGETLALAGKTAEKHAELRSAGPGPAPLTESKNTTENEKIVPFRTKKK